MHIIFKFVFHVEITTSLIMQFFVLWNTIQFKINTYFFAQIQSGGAEGVVVYILQFQFYRTSLVPAVYSGASFLFVDAPDTGKG